MEDIFMVTALTAWLVFCFAGGFAFGYFVLGRVFGK